MLATEINIGDKIFLQYKNKVVTVVDTELEEFEMPHGSHSIIKLIDNITVDYDGKDEKISIDSNKYYNILSKKRIEYEVKTLREKLEKFENALQLM